MQRGSLGYRVLKVAAWVIFALLMLAILKPIAWSLRHTVAEWGFAAGIALGAVILMAAWFADKWLDAHNARRAERLGFPPERPDSR